MKAWRDLAKLPRELWILCLATFINRLGTMALPFLVLYLTRSLGFSVARAAGAFALVGMVALVVSPISGRLSDRWGAARLMEAMLLAFGIVLLLYPLARSWPAVLVMTILFAATNEGFRPANLTLIGELSPAEHRKSAFALHRLGINLGMSVGPAVGGFLAQWSFPFLFIVDGLTALAAAAILFFSSFHPVVREREVQARTPSVRLTRTPEDARSRKWVLDAFFADADLRLFILGIIPVVIVFWQHESTLPLFMVRDLHFPASLYGLLFTINTLMIVTMEIPLNSATAHWPHRRTLVLGCVLFGIGFGSLAVANSFAGVALTVAIWTLGEMLLFPGMAAYVSEIAPKGRNGEYMGLYGMSLSLAFTAAPPLGTFVLEQGGRTGLWLGMFAAALLSAFVLGQSKRRTVKEVTITSLGPSGRRLG